MFKWLFKRQVKEEITENLKNLNLHLANSFMNVKKDMDSLSSKASTHNEKFNQIDQRLKFIESQILTFMSQQTPQQEKIEEIPSNIPSLDVGTVIEDLTYTQKKLLIALYKYQIKLNSPMTIKSLAKILYPDRKHGQVRTTITEYLDALASHGLVQKTRKRRQTYSNVTEKGEILIKTYLKKELKKTKKSQKAT